MKELVILSLYHRANEEERKVAERISHKLCKQLNSKTTELFVDNASTDAKSYLLDNERAYILSYDVSSDEVFEYKNVKVIILPPLCHLTRKPENNVTRKQTSLLIDQLSDDINKNNAVSINESEQINYIETTDSNKQIITIGKDLTDIVITETEAEYLMKLKELLKGSKIVISKGNLRLEIE